MNIRFAACLLAALFFLPLAQAQQKSLKNGQQAQAAAPHIDFSKMTGSFNMLKNSKVIQTIEEGDFLPENIDANVGFEILSGNLEFTAGFISVIANEHAFFALDTLGQALRITNRRISVPLQINLNGGVVLVAAKGTVVTVTAQTASVARGRIYAVYSGLVQRLEKGSVLNYGQGVMPTVSSAAAQAAP